MTESRVLRIPEEVEQEALKFNSRLKPGFLVVELEIPGDYRLTNDIRNETITFPQAIIDLLVDTGTKVNPVFEDTSR